MTENFLLMLIFFINIFSIALGLSHTHNILYQIDWLNSEQINLNAQNQKIMIQKLTNIHLKLLIIMNIAIKIILFTSLLLGCSAAGWGWWDWRTCDYSCDGCWYGYDPNYCDSCDGNRQANYWWGWYATCYCPYGHFDDGNAWCPACSYQCSSCHSYSTYCDSCNGAYRGSTPSCSCISGYYDNGSPNCQPCHNLCVTCVSTATTCTSCNSNLNRVLSGSSCVCRAGFFQNSSGLCQACNYKCTTCVSSASNCLSCAPNRISTPNCACSQYYYDDGSTPACPRCHYSCSTCTSASKCDTCNSSYLRAFTQVSTYCVCPDRYFDPGSQACSACHPTCFRCSSSASTSCTACNSAAWRILSSGTCKCMTGYYATSASVEQCQKCLYSCLTCSVSASNCTTCNSSLNRVLTSNTCPCAAKYFQNTTLLCDTCHSSCATCTSKLSCTTCISSQLTVLDSTGFCSCAAGRFWNTNVCSVCSYFCLTCVDATSNCTSCPANSNRVFSTGSCNCIAGYYDNNAVVCLPCSYTCQTCSTGLTTGCTACDSSDKRVLAGGACICATGYFDDGSNSACQQCNYKCQTCSSSSSCLTCSASLFRSYSSTTGFCECFSNYYESFNVCYPCMSTCVTCTNENTCTTCNSALNRFLNTTSYTCDCMPGYYLNSSGLCAPCNSLCATCTSGSTCVTCKDNLNRTLNKTTFTCDCSTGYILIASTNLCQTCQATCLTCVTNYTNRCSTCDSTTGRTLNSTSFQCQCPVGYFDDGVNLACQACSYTCLTCSGSAISCLSCPSGSNRTYNSITKTCLCNQRYYDNIVTFTQNASCLKCLYHCSTCVQGTTCLTCNSSNFRVMNNLTSKCICQRGYYDNGANQLCIACNYRCLSCTNATACLACNSSWNRDTPSARCPCSIGFYDNAVAVCLACHYSCLNCTNATQCVSCQGLFNRVYNSTTKLCSCTVGYYDPGSSICLLCSYQCLTCVTTGSRCLSCNTTVQRTFNSTANTCPCNNGYYDNAAVVCLPCNYTCSTCGNNRSCLTCNITRFRTISSLTGLCQCITGYYDNNSTQTCLACQATCLTCINSTNCTSCDSKRNRVLNHSANYANISDYFCPCLYKYYSLGTNNSCSPCHFSCSYCNSSTSKSCLYCNSASHRVLKNTGQCTCIDGYYDTNATQPCPTCNIACLTCWNSLTTTCFTCNTTNFMMVGANTCYVNCPTYYFNNVSAMICTSCQAHCLYCIDSTNCTQCESPMFLYNSSCQPKCPLGFYPNQTTHSCEPCKSGCANCSKSYDCFQCVNTSYYVDKRTTLCQLCSEACLTCFGPTQNNCLNCTYPLYLNQKHMCVNMTCTYGKYLDTFKGCQPCNSLFNHSITCNITNALLCSNPYMLVDGKCVGCNDVKGYALDSYNQCNEICGDGFIIYYQCDDGNTKNGDGCSANCIVEDGWKCTKNAQNKSICKLDSQVDITLKRVVKFARQNILRIVLKLSLPLQLNNQNFFVKFTNLDTLQYNYDIIDQDQTDLSQVSVDISYKRSIQNQQVKLTFSQSRRLLEVQASQPRLLAGVTFASNFNITAFPPANYITKSTYTYYDTAGSIIFYLSIVITVLNLIVVPKRYALHSITFTWIVPYLYFILYYSTSYTTEWVSSINTKLKYIAAYWGFSLGQCCIKDTIQSTTSQVMHNVGGILLLLIISWTVFIIISFFSFQIEAEALAKVDRIFKYYMLTAHLYFLPQLTYSSTFAIYNYTLSNKIDAINITIALFMLFATCFFIFSLWYITCISKFEGSFDQMSSKAATRHSIDKWIQNNTQKNDSNIIINLGNRKENNREENTEFNKTLSLVSSIVLKENGTHRSGFTAENRQKTEGSEQQEEMGEEQSFFPYDYCYLYKHANKKSKYFLPLLTTKLFLYSFFGVTLMNYPFGMMTTHLILSFTFFLYMCSCRPFQSKFTVARIIIVQILIIAIQGMFATYQYYAISYKYIQNLQYCIIMAIMVLLFFALIFLLLEQFFIWRESISKLCQNCCLSFRLKGKSTQVHDVNPLSQNNDNIIKVETVDQDEIGEVDAFYARILQKQALNRQYKKQRMIYDRQFEKDSI